MQICELLLQHRLQLWLWLYGFSSLLLPPHAAWQTDFTGWARVELQEWGMQTDRYWCGYSGVDIDVGSDSNSHEWAHSTSVYLFIFACISIARAACFIVFFISGDKKWKNIQAFSHEATAMARHHTASLFLHTICNCSMQQHPALVCYFCSKLKTLWYFL